MSVPVVFLHLGEQNYFFDAIGIAKRNNQVHVLGNQSLEFKAKINDSNVSFHNIQKYALSGEGFKSVYEHLHSGAVPQQMICYVRWFVIRDFMVDNNISCIFHADSDLAVLSNVIDLYKQRGMPYLALMTQTNQPDYRWVASGHASFWTLESIQAFCDYLMESYNNPEQKEKLRQKHNWHLSKKMEGGVCDMTQLYLFSKTCQVESLSAVHQNSCFDDNVNSSENIDPDEYEMAYGIKKISVEQDKFYFTRRSDNQMIMAHTIHCQGIQSKPLLNQIASYLRNLSL